MKSASPIPFVHAFLVLLILSLGLTSTSRAEEETTDGEARTVLKSTVFVDVREVAKMLNVLNVQYAMDEARNTLILRAKDKDMDTALAVIEALDAPRPSLDLRVFVVAASKEGTPRGNMPQGLTRAIEELKQVFGYRSFSLLDTGYLRVLQGRRGQLQGGITLHGERQASTYHVEFNKVQLEPDLENEDTAQQKVRVHGLSFGLREHGEDKGFRAYIRADVQFLVGQKAVVGSSTPAGSGETLLLIIEATVPDED